MQINRLAMLRRMLIAGQPFIVNPKQDANGED